jgi:hypothetical protein
MAVKYTKWPYYIPIFSIARPSKIYPNWIFWFENLATLMLAAAMLRPREMIFEYICVNAI